MALMVLAVTRHCPTDISRAFRGIPHSSRFDPYFIDFLPPNVFWDRALWPNRCKRLLALIRNSVTKAVLLFENKQITKEEQCSI